MKIIIQNLIKQNQVVLQETICSGIVGGRLDFPRYASFASVKIAIWLEDEFFAAYSRHSGLLDLSGTSSYMNK